MCCKKAHVIVFAFTLSSRAAYDNLQHYIDMVMGIHKDGIPHKDTVFIAVGNEIDSDEPRAIDTEEARNRFESLNPPVHYIESSTVTGENVRAILEYGVGECHARRLNNENKETTEKDSKKNCLIM